MHFSGLSAWAIALAFTTFTNAFRNVMYIDEWHTNIKTNHSVTTGITHVVMAFVDPKNFSTPDSPPSPPLMSVKDVRSYFDSNTKVGIALGGWGDFSASFRLVSTKENRTTFSTNLRDWMIKEDYDFVDIDWEYPGGNGALATPDPDAEIENFPLFLEAVKDALKPRGISLAVAATPTGMGAFKSPEQTKPIWDSIDFITVMAYDYVNRASNITGHHTDVETSKLAVQRYLDLGLPAEKINLGFAFFAKYFGVDESCDNFTVPDACSIVPAQYPNGTDNYESGVVTYELRNIDPEPVSDLEGVHPGGVCGYNNNTLTKYNCAESYCCSEYGFCGVTPLYCLGNCQVGYGSCEGPDTIASFKKARENFKYDEQKGGLWYFDETTNPKLFWTWENTDLMSRKFDEIVNNPANKLGGISGWSLGENSAGWGHVQQMQNMTRLRNSGDPGDECPELP
ncbi:glycoside hydrolase superfamily [Xylaria sp. FL1042]|nr:glycoside hydrolase superfamily [Xylaria sp. FL1042]